MSPPFRKGSQHEKSVRPLKRWLSVEIPTVAQGPSSRGAFLRTNMPISVAAVDHPDVPAISMPDRFRHDVTYFATPAGVQDAPAALAEREYWIRLDDARRILDDGAITIVSPLDSASRTEIEITEDQERWLEWVVRHGAQHVRIE